MSRVVVTNRNEEVFTSRFDGKVYIFEPGKPVTVEVAAAAFLFGFGLPESNHERVMVRNGWLKTSESDDFGPDAALRRLRGFVFNKAEEPAQVKPKAIDLPARPSTPPAASASIPGPSDKPQAPSGAVQESAAGGDADRGATATLPAAQPPAAPPTEPSMQDAGLVKRVSGAIRGAIGMPKGGAPRAAIGPAAR